MNKVKKLILGIKLLIREPSLINLITNSDYYWSHFLKKKHPEISKLPTIDIQEIIPKFNESLNTFSFLGGGSLPTDIMLLKGLCAQIPNSSYFEIGTWRGESVVNVAETAKECYTLNLSKKEISNLGLPKKYADLHGFFSKGKENITHLFGDSTTYNFDQLNKKFDVIFIDGNHTYSYVKNDTEKIFKHLVKENSVVVWHDYANNPEEIRPEVLVGILDGIPNACIDNLYHVSNTLCAIYTNKKVKSKILNTPVEPENIFTVSSRLRKI